MENYLPTLIILVIFAAFIIVFLFLQTRKEVLRLEITNSTGKPVLVDAELANTATKRMRGLMFRDSLGGNEGMLFVFNDEDYRSFWMMNTTIPLDAIFFSSNGTVVDIMQMDPCKSLISCPSYKSSGRAMYVLEVNSGFAEKNGFVAGKSRLKLPY
jgi:uncharacterized membrane protein (UPF0127 family)